MSTIKVDTYLTRGGASEIAIDKLKGVSTADSIAIQTGATTTVLQKGMLKTAVHFNSLGGNVLSENLNVSSIDDDGTGQQGVNITSALSSANYTTTVGLQTTNLHNTAATSRIQGVYSKTTTEVNLRSDYLNSTSYYAGGIEGSLYYNLAAHGDLA